MDEELLSREFLESQDLEVTETKEFIAKGTGVMYGDQCVGWAKSNTMARRIARALNEHLPNRKGR
jgi:3-deoxy-D-arabino-heptulosonate 7-phosphate (DAHP) synthase